MTGHSTLTQLMTLKDRVAVVTGGAGHIGRAIGAALAELGASVVVLDLSRDACHEAAEGMTQAFGVQTLALTTDLAVEDEVRRVPDTVLARFGRLDILINNAALVGTSDLSGWAVPFPQQRADTWRKALEVNLTVPFVLSQACASALAASGHGSIVNVASIYGLVGPDLALYEGTPLGNPGAYAASKGGLIQFTRWLATTLAPTVRVNAITAGGVWRNQPAAFHDKYVSRTPLRRMASEEDFKGAAAYLASDLSRYVTGHNLVVDGGWTAW